MSATTLFLQPFLFLQDEYGNPIVGGSVTTFAAGTTTPQAVYQDPDLTIPWTQPIVTNAAGQSSGPVFVSPTPALKIVAVDANNVAVPGFPMDNWSPAEVAS